MSVAGMDTIWGGGVEGSLINILYYPAWCWMVLRKQALFRYGKEYCSFLQCLSSCELVGILNSLGPHLAKGARALLRGKKRTTVLNVLSVRILGPKWCGICILWFELFNGCSLAFADWILGTGWVAAMVAAVLWFVFMQACLEYSSYSNSNVMQGQH